MVFDDGCLYRVTNISGQDIHLDIELVGGYCHKVTFRANSTVENVSVHGVDVIQRAIKAIVPFWESSSLRVERQRDLMWSKEGF